MTQSKFDFGMEPKIATLHPTFLALKSNYQGHLVLSSECWLFVYLINIYFRYKFWPSWDRESGIYATFKYDLILFPY